MKRQISTRLGAAHVRDTMEQFVGGLIDVQSAMEDLGIGRTRLYELRTAYLSARAGGALGSWSTILNVSLRKSCIMTA